MASMLVMGVDENRLRSRVLDDVGVEAGFRDIGDVGAVAHGDSCVVAPAISLRKCCLYGFTWRKGSAYSGV